MDDLRIRPAGSDDEAFLLEMLYEALFVPCGAEPFPRSVLADPGIAHYVRGFGHQDGDVGFVAEGGTGSPIGAVWARRFDEHDPGYGWVDAATPELTIAVHRERRGGGIGRVLLGRLVGAVPRVSLSVDERNPACRLYLAHGFVVVRREGRTLTMLRDGMVPGDS